MPSTSKECTNRFLVKHLLIYPFLFLVHILDFIVGLVLPYKYRDDALPDKHAVLSAQVDPTDTKSPFRSTMHSDLVRVEDKNANLYAELCQAAENYWDAEAMGVREILSIEEELQPNGKKFNKYVLDSTYKWITYAKLLDKINSFSNGLLKLGLKSGQNVVLFAETRPEWLMSAFGCFRINVPIVTLYATLGVDALAFGINQTNASYVFTIGEQLPKLKKILSKISHITHIIVFDDKLTDQYLNEFRKNCPQTISVYTMSEVEKMGAECEPITDYKSPKKDDLAIIMYTSGSTGNPKGVMISHGNLLSIMRGVVSRLGTTKKGKDIYISYLPLAHVLELACELTFLTNGIKLGYSTPQTITDTSTAIKRGQKGDLRVLKPTIMAAVPIVLERLNKTVFEKLSATSWLKQDLFNCAYKQKLEAFRAGRSTRLLDRLLFKRISRAVLGGKCRLIISGGAILSKEVHEFIQVCLCPLIQAYGLTETCGGATTQLPNQTDTETVGSVVPCCEIKLVDWAEGGYRTTDRPCPRGEIYIGGDNVTLGYFNMPEKTAEDFSVSKDGLRYFATGDIGEMLPNGNLKLIDRKKDLVKLQGGEYVSLNKIESLIKLLPFIDNCCLIANPFKNNCVLLACGNTKKLKEHIKEEQEVNRDETESMNSAETLGYLQTNPKLVEKLHQEMFNHCLQHGLQRFEIPTRIFFVKEAWTPDNGLVTDSLKLKRKEIDNFYKKEIDQLYS